MKLPVIHELTHKRIAIRHKIRKAIEVSIIDRAFDEEANPALRADPDSLEATRDTASTTVKLGVGQPCFTASDGRGLRPMSGVVSDPLVGKPRRRLGTRK